MADFFAEEDITHLDTDNLTALIERIGQTKFDLVVNRSIAIVKAQIRNARTDVDEIFKKNGAARDSVIVDLLSQMIACNLQEIAEENHVDMMEQLRLKRKEIRLMLGDISQRRVSIETPLVDDAGDDKNLIQSAYSYNQGLSDDL